MADQVIIRLEAHSAQLEASLTRLEKSLLRLQSRSQTTQGAMQKGAQRTSKSINQQNKSFTLLVAKFALISFAAQTLGNIFQSTFGAVLKQIDDFQLAAIGTAAAITGITAETDRPIGDVFEQNFEAAKQVFEELEIVAARFFSTGQELQLAFNTLAQKGVVVREDEFNILGKLTDQIKLLTGGQNSQIQIQQELRAILDGNVRTTTTFGKSLQARGVDIQQLSKEIRATGSIKVFEQFLTGLDAAGNAVRRTLTSVTSTFTSLFNILARNIFQDTFDGVVERITKINNFLIDQRSSIIAIGRFLKSEIAGAWNGILSIVNNYAGVIARLVSNDLVQLAAAILIILKLLKSGPLGILFAIPGIFALMTGRASTFVDVLNLMIDSVDIFITGFLDGLGNIIETFQELTELGKAFIKGGFTLTFDAKALQRAEQSLRDQARNVEIAANRVERLNKIQNRTVEQQKDLNSTLRVQAQLQNNVLKAAQGVSDATNKVAQTQEGRDFLFERSESTLVNLRESLGDFIADAAKNTADLKVDLGLGGADDEIAKLFAQLKDLSKGFTIPVNIPVDFAKVDEKIEFDPTITNARIAAARAIEDSEIKGTKTLRDNELSTNIARIQKEAAFREETARRAFAVELIFRERQLKADIAQLEIQKKITEERARQDELTVDANLNVDVGDNKITPQQAAVQRIEIIKKETLAIQQIDLEIGKNQTKIDNARLAASARLKKDSIEIAQLLAAEERRLNLFGRGGTNSERLANSQAIADQNIANFDAERPGATTEQRNQFVDQQNRNIVQEQIKPQIEAFAGAVDSAFGTLADGLATGSFEFKQLAETVSKDLITSGLMGLIEETKALLIQGLESIFEGIGKAGAGAAAQALALGIGLLISVLSKTGNDGDFTASGAGAGSSVQSSAQTRGLIGGDTALPIAEINNGLMEALIPTNAILSQIERNTRNPLTSGSLDPSVLNGIIEAQLSNLLGTQGLQGA